MNRTEKEAVVAELTETFRNNNFVYLADTTGLTANATNQLRRMLFENGVSMRVVKNTLVKLAMENSGKDFGDLVGQLKGTSAVLVSENLKAPAVSLKKFRANGDKPVLKGAFIDNGIFIGDNQLDALVNLKSKEDLIGDVIALLQSPARNVISALQSSGHKLAGIVKTLQEKNA